MKTPFVKSVVIASLFLMSLGPAQASVVEVNFLTLPDDYATSAVVDPVDNVAYFFGTTSPLINDEAEANPVDLTAFSLTFPAFSSTAGPVPVVTSLYDPVGHRIYMGGDVGSFSASNAAAIAVPIVSPIQYSTATAPSNPGALSLALGASVIDAVHGHVIYGTNSSPAQLVVMTTATATGAFTFVSSTTFPSTSNITAAALDPDGLYAYFASSTVPSVVTKVQLSDLSVANTLTLGAGEGGASEILIDSMTNTAYVATHNSPALVVRIDLPTFKETGHISFLPGENDVQSMVFDGVDGYFGLNTQPGIVVDVNMQSLSERTGGGVALPSGQNYLTAAVVDNNEYGYFQTNTTPSIVAKVDLLGGKPVITEQPQDADANDGQSATFVVKVRTRTATYQWQRDGVDIAGATSSAYIINPVSLTDDSASFRCVITNTYGQTVSNSAQLTVLPTVRVYPDPWRADRHSGVPITFDHLPNNCQIKIFTVSARWVTTIVGTGGTSHWDRTNADGQMVATGYYYYTITTSDARQTVQGKLAIIK